MTTPAFCTEADVREVIKLNASASSDYSSDLIGSNIRSAAWFLERVTKRIARDETDLSLKFSTHGRAATFIPGLRSASSVTLNGSTLTEDESFWLIPDDQQTGVFTGIQFRAFTRGSDPQWYLSYPDWFDRNLDSPKWRPEWTASLPNDLVIRGAWGYTDATLPEPWRHANKALAAYYTLHGDVMLSSVRVVEGGSFDLSQLPIEVQTFVADWSTGKQAVGL